MTVKSVASPSPSTTTSNFSWQMASDDETFACDTCSIYFTSASTLRQHVAACHTAAPPASTPRPAASSAIDPATNLEVAPLLTILSSDQKDLLILRALQRQPALADLLLGMAAEPISPEEAAARIEALSDGAAAEVAVRSYLEIGATENALTLLGALSEAVQEALEALAEVALPAAGGGASSVEASDWQSGDEIAAVEQLPSAGSVAVLWREVLAAAAAELDDDERDELREVVDGVQQAATAVRAVLPAVLVGPDGGAADVFAAVLKQLAPPSRPAKKAKTS